VHFLVNYIQRSELRHNFHALRLYLVRCSLPWCSINCLTSSTVNILSRTVPKYDFSLRNIWLTYANSKLKYNEKSMVVRVLADRWLQLPRVSSNTVLSTLWEGWGNQSYGCFICYVCVIYRSYHEVVSPFNAIYRPRQISVLYIVTVAVAKDQNAQTVLKTAYLQQESRECKLYYLC